MLPEHASAGDQWILDKLVEDPPERCPQPELSNMLVLDSYGRDWAYVVWLADDVDVCVAALTRDRGRTIMFGPIAEFANRTRLIGPVQFDPAIFAVFPGIDSEIVLKGDTPHTFDPARSRTVALGAGRVVTFAVSRFAVPFQGSQLGGQLCPARDGVCQPMRP